MKLVKKNILRTRCRLCTEYRLINIFEGRNHSFSKENLNFAPFVNSDKAFLFLFFEGVYLFF